MARQRTVTVSDHRAATQRLRWLTLAAPELAREAKPGHYLLVRCDEPGGARLLRRALFVAAVEPALGQLGLLFEPNEPGLRWLARAHSGDTLDVLGPLGRPFAMEPRSRSLLLIGSGPGLGALLCLARASAARGAAVTLLAGAEDQESLPPAFLLPDDVEYETVAGPVTDLMAGAPVQWADQLFAALPHGSVEALRDTVRAGKLRWERGFASVLLEGPLVCGVGACNACVVTARKGARLLCIDGPVFDLREL
jgi:dihydroorotate dehydrogenase electron transfer subunit